MLLKLIQIMKKQDRFFTFSTIFCFCVFLMASACSSKSGCPAQESLKPKVNKKGEIVSSHNRHQEGLFPKKMKKRMK
jgi:hypothetical protein